MASASRIRAFQLLSSRTLEFLCEEASAHRPAPLERLERLCADLLFDRQLTTPASVPVWCPESELPF
ncbi:hypothetical protein KBY99_13160 [Cyanobium sp. Maggiore-St4-Cus]|jgi:hypothetical protein|uniref:hypothetical protein n=1 Tax=unclassified Cyanobium TaxID=2627006 RepID=UPI0020CD1969|nr:MULTISPECIES: hypothetical protein [unclassified Cyanobium]MCP9789914.1 hypothetical protein [Cyanobium sp. Maggiore-St4-Cus]MCP9880522.1 hypothetical protein [Cyanobium sp. A1C-AMD]